MKIQCDVCEKAEATVICCADEAALCAECDVQIHAANKLASKHQRLLLDCLSNKLPPCDICQERTAFIFCVEDRALFCKDCDATIHSANSRAANHQRFLATGIRVALSSNSNNNVTKDRVDPNPPIHNSQHIATKLPFQHVTGVSSPSWPPVDELLRFSDYESLNKKDQLEFGGLDWFTDTVLFGEQLSPEGLVAAEVPQLPISQPSDLASFRPAKFHVHHKKPRIEFVDDEEDYLLVPDLG